MSVYCISDIHGNLKAMQRLLEKADFKYDGTDQLYLLGDYVDWGYDSMETVQFLMKLSENDFVHCLIGNHDWMFFREMQNTSCGELKEEFDENWLYRNRGKRTWNQYMALSLEERRKIKQWFSNLLFGTEVSVLGQWYLLGHASPYFEEKEASLDKKLDAVWKRMSGAQEDPLTGLKERFSGYEKEIHPYQKFICGHSITDHYQGFQQGVPLSIFKGEHFIDIDCGAKCLMYENEDPSVVHALFPEARLAMLRLDDMEEFYCDAREAGYIK